MDPVITEKKYPIQRLWVLKQALSFPCLFFFIVAFTVFLLGVKLYSKGYGDFGFPSFIFGNLFLFFCLFTCLVQTLCRKMFHYSIDDKFLNLRQGVLSKQQRFIPYGVIQNILVSQGLLDRLFGFAALTIENASQGAGSLGRERGLEMVGFYGNKVCIPGLTKQNAEALKAIILQKMKENPIDDNRSGL